MSMVTLIEQARESAKRHIEDRKIAVESFSETLSDGSQVTCTPVCSSNPFEMVIRHVKITWKLNNKRATAATIEKLFNGLATDEEKKELADFSRKQKFLAKYGY
jgi:hypothetical protein